MPYTGTRNAEHVKAWCDKKRAQGLCIKCGRNKAAPNRSKCKPCAIRSAAEQQEFRDRMKQWEARLAERNTGISRNA